jgi:HAD superfamily hydrolase (TIGR01509 family)
MDIQALIFDCDGTLTDSMPVHYLAWRATLSRYGVALDEDRFYALGGMPTDKIVAMLAAEQGIPLDPVAIAQEKEADFLRSLHLIEPIAPVIGALHAHRGRLKLAVASGGWRNVVERQLRQIGIFDHFAAIVTAEDTERHKPEPDVFLEAARRLDIPAVACRVYEDSDLGIEAARRAGMTWVDVRLWYTPRRVTTS